MPEIFWRHLAWKAESSLSEDELSRKVLGPAVYTKIYCRVQWNRVLFIPVKWENLVTLTMKRIEAGRQFPMIKQLPWQLAVNRGAVGESRTSGWRGITPWGKPVSAINTVRKSQASVALRRVEIPPLYRIWRTSPAYSCSSTSSWPLSRLYPVLCLDAISRLGKWAPGGIITFLLPRGSFAQPAVWRPGTALDLASQWPGTRDEPLCMRGDCAICGRGAEFPRASARRLPDFSSPVFIALTGFTSRSFPLSGPM